MDPWAVVLSPDFSVESSFKTDVEGTLIVRSLVVWKGTGIVMWGVMFIAVPVPARGMGNVMKACPTALGALSEL
jgi:hypothetical protein